MNQNDTGERSHSWRRPEFTLPASVVIFLIVVWPLWGIIDSHFGAVFPAGAEWVLSSLYFGLYIWLEFIAVGCSATHLLVFLNSVLFGILASAALILYHNPAFGLANRVGGKHTFLLVLIPTLLLIIELQVVLKRRTSSE